MHKILLTLFLVVVAGVATAQNSDCTQCGDCQGIGGCGYGCEDGIVPGCCGPMPQTCYAPRFGCYSGNNRHMHRYPAFHGYYYRTPYNYRHLFDYPWHATPNEPLGFFTYQNTDLLDNGAANPFRHEGLPAVPLEPVPAEP